MPLAIGRDGEAAIAARHERHARFESTAQVAPSCLDHSPLHGRIARRSGRLIGLGEFRVIGEHGEGRRYMAARLQDGLDASVVHEKPMENHVHTGLGGIQHGFPAIRVHGDFFAQAVNLIDHRARFILGECADVLAVGPEMRAVHGDLHQVDTVFGLAANLGDLLVARNAQAAAEIIRRAHPTGEPVVEALPVADHVAAGGDTRPSEHAGVDGVTHRDTALACVARYHHRGVASRQHMLGEEQTAQGAKLWGHVQIDVFFALGIAKHQMGMDIHQARHHEVFAGIDDLLTRRRLGRSRLRADIGEQAVLDHQTLALARGVFKASKQGLAVDMQTRHGVVLLLLWGGPLHCGVQQPDAAVFIHRQCLGLERLAQARAQYAQPGIRTKARAVGKTDDVPRVARHEAVLAIVHGHAQVRAAVEPGAQPTAPAHHQQGVAAFLPGIEAARAA